MNQNSGVSAVACRPKARGRIQNCGIAISPYMPTCQDVSERAAAFTA